MTTKPNTTTTPAPTQNQTLPKTGVDGSATVKGMQTTLDFWKNKCKDKDEGSPTSTKVPKGRKPTQNSKGRAMTTTRRKCKSDNFSQIQGQSKILSFLEHKKIQWRRVLILQIQVFNMIITLRTPVHVLLMWEIRRLRLQMKREVEQNSCKGQ